MPKQGQKCLKFPRERIILPSPSPSSCARQATVHPTLPGRSPHLLSCPRPDTTSLLDLFNIHPIGWLKHPDRHQFIKSEFNSSLGKFHGVIRRICKCTTKKCMGFGPHFPSNRYGLWVVREYGLWTQIPCKPSWWIEGPMGYQGVWVTRAMG